MKTQTKTITLTLGVLLISLFAIAFVSAADGKYCFKKVYNGQSIPAYSGFTVKTQHLDCKNGKCTVFGFSNPSGHLNLCTDPDGYYYSNYNKCEDFCSGSGTIDLGPLTLSANFPFADNGVFTKQSFFLDIYTNKIAKIELIDNLGGAQKILCPNCMSYKRSASFNKGFNDITIRAIEGLEVKTYRIRFYIDNQKPRITKTLPAQKKFSNGEFTIFYDEDNIKSISLSYGFPESPITKSLTGCESGKKKNCTTTVDLSFFDGQEISYWFTILDIADNLISSRALNVFVDKTAPNVLSFDYTVDAKRRNVNFMINVTDANMDKIIYYDNEATRASILCSSLRKDRFNPSILSCIKRSSFRPGHHSLNMEIRDKAGNFAPKTIEFDID